MDRGAWRATVHRVGHNLSDYIYNTYLATEISAQGKVKAASSYKEAVIPALPAVPSFFQKRTLLGPEPRFSSQDLTWLSVHVLNELYPEFQFPVAA